MAIGKINLDSNILNQYTQKSFETFMDGVGKPISKNELLSGFDLNKISSPLINDILNYSNTTLDKLTEQVKKNKLISGIEKALNSIGKAIGVVVDSIKNTISAVIRMGYNTLSKVLGVVSDFIKNNKFINMFKKAIGAILGILGLPLLLIAKIVPKVTALISKGLSALGLKNKIKSKLNNPDTPELDRLLTKCVDKACSIGILSELDLDNGNLYTVSKKLIKSSDTESEGYSKVMKSFKYIINSNMRLEQDYPDVYRRLEKEYSVKYGTYPQNGFLTNEDDVMYSKYIMNMPDYNALLNRLPVIDESRGWMNYDPSFLSYMSMDELISFSKNPEVKRLLPQEGISDKNSKSYFNSLNNKNLTNYEKMIIFSEYKRMKYYSKDKNTKSLKGTSSIFSGFTSNTELPLANEKIYPEVKKTKTTSL